LRASRLLDGAEMDAPTRVRTVVDFGCGTGNLILPLAAAEPSTRFVGLDLNPRSVALLRERAEAAGLTNVRAEVGLIEDYEGPCDLALALHVCGDGTDAVLLQAQARGSAFVVAPCCVGKLKDGGLSSISGMKRELGADGDEPDPDSESDSAGTVSTEGTVGNASASDATSGGLVVNPGPGRRRATVIHPRSTWMRGRVQRPDYLSLAAAADWSGHQGVDATSAPGALTRLPRAAKAAVELDRGAAAAEAGYGVRVMKMLHEGSGLKNDVIVGFPRGEDPLRRHVDGPAATWDLSA
jgi:SAM-dependent methyltransferase